MRMDLNLEAKDRNYELKKLSLERENDNLYSQSNFF